MFAEQQHQYDFQENDYPALKNDNPMYSSSHITRQSADPTQRSFRWIFFSPVITAFPGIDKNSKMGLKYLQIYIIIIM